MDDYFCPNCQMFFQNAQLLADHEEIGCELDDVGGAFPTYCCGMIYEHGETTCHSCGEPL